MSAIGTVVLWALASVGAIGVTALVALAVLIASAEAPSAVRRCRYCRAPLDDTETTEHPTCAQFEQITQALK